MEQIIIVLSSALFTGVVTYIYAVYLFRRERYFNNLIDKIGEAEKEGKIKCKLTIDSNRKGKLEIWNRK